MRRVFVGPMEGKARDMGRLYGDGGWIGPRSRYASWVSRRWWHFYVGLGVLGVLMMFPAYYFGLMSDASEHELLPSLIGAVFFGAGLGLLMCAFEAWGRRRNGQDEDHQ